jgi:hypothetical protein
MTWPVGNGFLMILDHSFLKSFQLDRRSCIVRNPSYFLLFFGIFCVMKINISFKVISLSLQNLI